MKQVYVVMQYASHNRSDMDDASLLAVCDSKKCAQAYIDAYQNSIEAREDYITYDIVEMDLLS